MKFYISADIEGVTGVTTWKEADDIGTYEARVQMTREVNAVCEALLMYSDAEIIIKDAHGMGKNLIHEQLPRCVEVISGWSNHPYNMVEGLDESFDGIIFVGYHSAAGSGESPLAHTLNPRLIREVRINGKRASELSIYMTLADLLGVPTYVVTGDHGITEEAKALNQTIDVVSVKKAFSGAVKNIHPGEAANQILEVTKDSVTKEKSIPSLTNEMFTMEVVFKKQQDAYKYSFYPNVEQVDDFTISLTSEKYIDLLTLLIFM